MTITSFQSDNWYIIDHGVCRVARIDRKEESLPTKTYSQGLVSSGSYTKEGLTWKLNRCIWAAPRVNNLNIKGDGDYRELRCYTSLVKSLAAKKVSSYDVTLAFCKRAALAHQLVCWWKLKVPFVNDKATSNVSTSENSDQLLSLRQINLLT